MKRICILSITLVSLLLMSCAKEEVVVETTEAKKEEVVEIKETTAKVETVEKTLDDYVSEALLSKNNGMYLEGVCKAESHKILGKEENGNTLKVYALTMYGEYDFKSDMFIKVAGSGTIPAVLTFIKDGNEYKIQDIEYPTDGGGFLESAKKLFPEKYHPFVLSITDETQKEMTENERKYAERYLKQIRSNAKIGDYADIIEN